MPARVRQWFRYLADRVARSHLKDMRQGIRKTQDPIEAGALKNPDGVPDDIHNLLHELRTMELGRVPKGARTAISIGASGRWYFDWFEHNVGRVDRHYGIEAFEPRPDDLPAYVEWVKATADDLHDVPDAAGDMLFAGQTTEHLWPQQLSGFLTEAWRVLAPDKLLVLDSPNRLVSQHMMWSHGGHTIELSAHEMIDLLAVAGFEVESWRGLWFCRLGGSVQELEDGIEDLAVVARRIEFAREAPEDAFIWWINARRTSNSPPDRNELQAQIASLFDRHWPVRVCRGMDPHQTESTVKVGRGDELRLSTLPFPLYGGGWTIGLKLVDGSVHDLGDLSLRITAPGGTVYHQLNVADGEERSPTELVWRIEQPYLLFALTLAITSPKVRRPCAIDLPLQVLPEPGWFAEG